jgi:predicted dehydrogenase
MIKNVLIYGFGRMGLTHYSILNQLIDNGNFVFVDPDKRVNFFTQRNLKASIASSDDHLKQSFDYALICTPPMFHIPILKRCLERSISNIFVEKPFGGVDDNFDIAEKFRSRISVGYVLRFNPIVKWIKENVKVEDIQRVEGYYFSNTIEKKPKGWRNGRYSGVTNEVGSHIIDLSIYLFGLCNPELIDMQKISVISDVDDIMVAELRDNNISFHFRFDWVNKDYRKPVFKFIITMNDGSIIKFDQQKIEQILEGNVVKLITSVDLAAKVPFYLRGVEFTDQMQNFITSRNTIASYEEARINRSLVVKLIS